MPRWLQVVLAVIAVCFVTLVILGFVGYRWLNRNRGRLAVQAREISRQGAEYGRGKEIGACLDESARIYQTAGKTFKSQITTRLWLESCIRASTVPPEFCANVPRKSQAFASGQWALEECAKRGLPNDQGCSNLLVAAVGACDLKRE
ncbi:MAG TPA: hypothetical protein VJ276_09460 [Thermoanaerobaculia bacterium]|nr:hypothetical protein [Thermoanaerobaculia bacterium]